MQYKTEILVRVNTIEHWFEICDTGEGMSPLHITNQFAVIGRSISQEQEILDRSLTGNDDDRLFLIAKFGIGFISTFIISKSVVISTKHEGFKQISFRISDVNEPFCYTEFSEVGRPADLTGTTVRVNLRSQYREDGAQKLDVVEAVRKYCRHVPFLTLEIDGRPAALQDDWNISAIGDEHTETDEPLFERTIPRLYQCKLTLSGSRERGVVFSNQGFYIEINAEQIVPKEMPAVISGEVNFFPGVIDVNIARDKIIKGLLTDKLSKEFAEDLRQLFKNEHEAVRVGPQKVGRPLEASQLAQRIRRRKEENRSSMILYCAMYYLLSPSSAAILTETEAAEFILDAWTVNVPSFGDIPFRAALRQVNAERDGKIFYQKSGASGRLTDAQKVFKESFTAAGETVISSEARAVHFADGSQAIFDEADVLIALSRRYMFTLVDISAPAESDLARIIIPLSDVHPTLAQTAQRLLEIHGTKIEYTLLAGPAAFSHADVHYINLENDEMKEYVVRLGELTSDIVFTYVCGLVQKAPFRKT
jgi:hypothetical protein